MPLADYLETFRTLNRAHRNGSPRTRNRQPHKPLLLLSLADLIASGFIEAPEFSLSPELNETFDAYWSRALPHEEPGNIATPVDHLRHNGFWRYGANKKPRSIVIDRELFELFGDDAARAALKAALIQSHFDTAAAAELNAYAGISEAAAADARAQLARVQPPAQASAPVRSQAFRIVVVHAYDHRCAICGVRIYDENGRTVVEAAHIVPWSKTHDDSPQNGLSLCRLCHWSFDAGMLTISESLRVMTSSRLSKDGNHAGLLSVVADRNIIPPKEARFHPAADNLEYHRARIFKR